jgi:hypothetical protein
MLEGLVDRPLDVDCGERVAACTKELLDARRGPRPVDRQALTQRLVMSALVCRHELGVIPWDELRPDAATDHGAMKR